MNLNRKAQPDAAGNLPQFPAIDLNHLQLPERPDTPLSKLPPLRRDIAEKVNQDLFFLLENLDCPLEVQARILVKPPLVVQSNSHTSFSGVDGEELVIAIHKDHLNRRDVFIEEAAHALRNACFPRNYEYAYDDQAMNLASIDEKNNARDPSPRLVARLDFLDSQYEAAHEFFAGVCVLLNERFQNETEHAQAIRRLVELAKDPSPPDAARTAETKALMDILKNEQPGMNDRLAEIGQLSSMVGSTVISNHLAQDSSKSSVKINLEKLKQFHENAVKTHGIGYCCALALDYPFANHSAAELAMIASTVLRAPGVATIEIFFNEIAKDYVEMYQELAKGNLNPKAYHRIVERKARAIEFQDQELDRELKAFCEKSRQ